MSIDICLYIYMKKVHIQRLSYDDTASIDDIHVSSEQSAFISPPQKVMSIFKELGNEETNLPFTINIPNISIGFFTLNFYCPIAVQADPVFFGGENDCRLETFMIDETYQGQGFGKAAINEILCLLKNDYPHIEHLKLSVNFLNERAKLFYLKYGFTDTELVYNGGPSGPQHIFTLELTS